jgi:ABC-type branched-subunit amino acid transport system ATPase component
VPEELFELCAVLKGMLGRRGDLSGGQQQQLAVTRSHNRDRRLLLHDGQAIKASAPVSFHGLPACCF